MNALKPLILAAALAAASPAVAEKVGANGGTVTVAGHHAVEFVASGTELAFFLQDEDGKPMATAGMTARAVVADGGKTSTVTLAAAVPNRFTGTLVAPLGRGARVVFSTRAHGHALQARFERK